MCLQISYSHRQKQWCWQLPNADHIPAQFLHFECPTVYQIRERAKTDIEQIYENKGQNHDKREGKEISSIIFLYIYCFLLRLEHQQTLKAANIKQVTIPYFSPWYNVKLRNLNKNIVKRLTCTIFLSDIPATKRFCLSSSGLNLTQ